ncbi:ISAzo13-like element transposase-related protein [Methyloprofundus sp.]|uniref:ISAzo13-like element transposase-related protein n=1 Tax=Methyloprofundus sp. TaxID=2020875 RepID=UPI003D143F7E
MENSSSRTQFIKRLVEFAEKSNIKIKLAYYPPYHSKYNPIERVWGAYENHISGDIMVSAQ